MMAKLINLIDKKFGLLTVQSFVKNSEGGHRMYQCKCDCGNIVIRTGTSIKRSKKL